MKFLQDILLNKIFTSIIINFYINFNEYQYYILILR